VIMCSVTVDVVTIALHTFNSLWLITDNSITSIEELCVTSVAWFLIGLSAGLTKISYGHFCYKQKFGTGRLWTRIIIRFGADMDPDPVREIYLLW